MLTDRDKERLAKVDPRLVLVVTRAAADNPGAFFVDKDAWRDVVTEEQMIDAGVSKLHNPYNSKHVIGPARPLSHAVDLYPEGFKTVAEIPQEAYARVANMVKVAAEQCGVGVDWGYDLWRWDRPHYQLRGA